MKIALILAASKTNSPYAEFFTRILSKNDIEYDIIYWDKSNIDNDSSESKFKYRGVCQKNASKIQKLKALLLYKRFVKKILNSNNYDFVIVHTLQLFLILSNVIIFKYWKKIILDIRDYNFLFKKLKIKYSLLFNGCAMITISSDGFRRWLPSKYNYLLSENTIKELFINLPKSNLRTDIIRISNIGNIRDFKEQKVLLDYFKNDQRYEMHFCGAGIIDLLQDYSEANNIGNARFNGRYNKVQEVEMYDGCTFINLILGGDVNSQTLLTNRFYNAIISGKPMIVSNSYQGELVMKFGLGIMVDDINNLKTQIECYMNNFNQEQFQINRDSCIKEIISRQLYFEDRFLKLLTSTIY